jgi:hypothetical protein
MVDEFKLLQHCQGFVYPLPWPIGPLVTLQPRLVGQTGMVGVSLLEESLPSH